MCVYCLISAQQFDHKSSGAFGQKNDIDIEDNGDNADIADNVDNADNADNVENVDNVDNVDNVEKSRWCRRG